MSDRDESTTVDHWKDYRTDRGHLTWCGRVWDGTPAGPLTACDECVAAEKRWRGSLSGRWA